MFEYLKLIKWLTPVRENLTQRAQNPAGNANSHKTEPKRRKRDTKINNKPKIKKEKKNWEWERTVRSLMGQWETEQEKPFWVREFEWMVQAEGTEAK